MSVGIPFAALDPHHLRMAIRSVFAQTLQEWELVLLADGAPAELVDIAVAVEDERVRTLVMPSRIGLSDGLNRIASEASAPLLARMDADDVMLPGRLARLAAHFDAHPDVDLIASRAVLIDERGAVHGLLKEQPEIGPLDRAILRNPITHPTVAARTAWFRGHPYSTVWSRTEDKHLWQTAPPSSRAVKLPDALLAYRIPRAIDLSKIRRTRREDRRLLAAYGPAAVGVGATRSAIIGSVMGELALAGAAAARADAHVYRRKREELPNEEAVREGLRVVAATPGARVVNDARATDGVIGVTVTYGDRGRLCLTTIAAALAAGCERVVVVSNAATEASIRHVRERFGAAEIDVVELATNTGSAGGFRTGLERALGLGASAVWLLDDDNVAHPDALATMLAQWTRDGPGLPPALLAHRPTDVPQARVLDGWTVSEAYGPPGAFLYFDLPTRLARRFRALTVDRTSDPIAVPYGPYGGLLVDAETARAVPGPRVELWLYEDDTEYTARLAERAGLLLCPDALVDDAVGKWSGDARGVRGPGRFLASEDTVLRHYAIRNRVFFDATRARKVAPIRFRLNLLAYHAVLWGSAVIGRRVGAARKVAAAVREGIAMSRKIGAVR